MHMNEGMSTYENDKGDPICTLDELDQLYIYQEFPTNKIDRIQLKTFNDTVDIDKFKEPFIKQLTEEIAERKKQLSLLKKLSL